MRVLHVTPCYYPATYWGGPIFSVYGLNNALASIPEVELRVLTTDSAGRSLDQCLNVEALDKKKLFPGQEVIFAHRLLRNSTSFELLQHLVGLIKWTDVVHLTFVYSFPTFPVLLLCRLFHKPLVWSPRGALLDTQVLEFSRKKSLKKIWDSICAILLQPDKTILHTTSDEEKLHSKSKYPNIKSVVIRNGVEIPQNLPVHSFVPDGVLRILFLSRIARKKGLENLLDAMMLLKNNNVHLSICGTGEADYVASVQEKAKSFGLLDKSVQFLGHVDGDAKTEVFKNTDVFILPSFSENFGMAISEALAYGVPVITTHGTPWKKVEEKNCGLWIDNTPQSIADAVIKIKAMDLAQMGRNGMEWMKQDFSWLDVANQLHEVYAELILK